MIMAKPTKKDLENLFGEASYEEGLKIAAKAVIEKKTSPEEAAEVVGIFYDKKPKDVKKDLAAAIEDNPRESDEDRKKRESDEADAKEKQEAAEKAQAEADAATALAKKKSEEATAAKAAAAGKVAVEVPKTFILMVADSKGRQQRFTYQKGTTTMPREHADHWYAKANGVKRIGA